MNHPYAKSIVGGVLLLALAWMVTPVWGADGDAIAIVNGRPISERRLNEVLLDAYGLQVLQQLIVLDLAKERTKQLGLKVTRADIEAEFQRALRRIAPEVSEQNQPLSESERRQALDFMLQQKGISFAEFMLGMERNAHLRKVVEHDFTVSEDTLREEFARTYEERVEVRHIQIEVGDRDRLHEALQLLDSGTEFAEVARRLSQNPDTATRGGLMQPFTFKDDRLSPLLREKAFAMEPGEVSTMPLNIGRWWHLLKLERRLPPANVTFAEVRDEVEQNLRNRVITERMNTLVAEMFDRAKIRILDRELREKFENMMEQNRQAAPAATP